MANPTTETHHQQHVDSAAAAAAAATTTTTPVTGTVVYDQMTTSVQNNWSLIKHNRLRKRKANMASNIHSHQHLMGPALMAGVPHQNLGAYAENGVPSPEIFHFNHCSFMR